MLQVQLQRFGPPSAVVKCVQADPPGAPSAWDAVVRIDAFPINPSDIAQLAGQYGALPNPPCGIGMEASGEVLEIGSSVKHLSAGDRVMIMANNNWTQVRRLPASVLHKVSQDLCPLQTAMMKVNPATALLLMTQYGKLKPGDWIIQNAPSSNVGRAVIQIAKAKGFKTINVVRPKDAPEDVLEMGGDIALPPGKDLPDQVRQKIGRAKLNLALDSVGGKSTEVLASCLAYGATIVNFGMLSGEPCSLSPAGTIFGGITLTGFWLSKVVNRLPFNERTALYDEIAEMIRTGEVSGRVDKCFAIEDISEAIERAENYSRNGKVLVLPNGPLVGPSAEVDEQSIQTLYAGTLGHESNQQPPVHDASASTVPSGEPASITNVSNDAATSRGSQEKNRDGQTVSFQNAWSYTDHQPVVGQPVEVADKIWLIRLPLEMTMDHVNAYVTADDDDGFTLIDTGANSEHCLAALLSALEAKPFNEAPIRRVVATHFHPDHIGLAGHFTSQGAELLTPRTCWLAAGLMQGADLDAPREEHVAFLRQAGMPEPELQAFKRRRPSRYPSLVSELPHSYHALSEGDTLNLAGRQWLVRLGQGHAVDLVTLWSEDIAFVSDQILPGVSPSLSVHFSEPESEFVSDWIDSCEKFRDNSSPATLCLPGHNRPFTGAPGRCQQLIDSCKSVVNRVYDALQTPRTAFDCLSLVYRRQLSSSEQMIILGEMVGYLNFLKSMGRIDRTVSQDGHFVWKRNSSAVKKQESSVWEKASA